MARRFSFISSGLPGDSFEVVLFQGEEGLSQSYQFTIELASRNPHIDLDEVLQNPARLILDPEASSPTTFHGIIATIEQRHQAKGYTFYRAELVPRLWWLSQTRHNQIFLQKTLPEILQQTLQDGGLAPQDVELRLQQDYPRRDYVCQYNESHLNFFQRWLEHEGLYYFFEQWGQGEKLIVTDSHLSHGPQAQQEVIDYSSPTGLDAAHRDRVIHEFCCAQRLLPRSLRLKDYNDEKPEMRLEGEAPVWEEGRGEVYLYGDDFRTQAEGRRLARIRAEELTCRQRVFHGQGTVPFIQPGYRFTLRGHYRNAFNRGYLTTQIHHQGRQAAFMFAGLGQSLPADENRPEYHNSFTALPDDVQFRAPRQSHRPRFFGVMYGKIDGAGSGRYAELDDQGRYKVILPFDRSGRKGGTASAWLRMMQPYAGAGHGMHFPLHKGTDVLITFIDGDPDRPVIAGAVPNPDTPSVVTAQNATMANITTASGNRIHMEDKEGSERILLHSPKQNTFIRMGAHNDPEIVDDKSKLDKTGGKDYHSIPQSIKEEIWEECNTENKSIQIEAEDTMGIETGNIGKIVQGRDYTAVGGTEKKWVFGDSFTHMFGTDTKTYVGNKFDLALGLEEGIGILGKLEIQLAKVLEMALLEKTEFNLRHLKLVTEESKLIGIRKKLSAKEVKLNGQIQALTTDMERLNGSIRTTEGQRTELQGQLRHLVGDQEDIVAQRTELQAQIDRLTGEETRLSEQVTTISNQRTETTGIKERIVATETALAGIVEIV